MGHQVVGRLCPQVGPRVGGQIGSRVGGQVAVPERIAGEQRLVGG